MGYKTFTTMFHSGVVPVMDYCSEVWGYGRYECCNKIQNRAMRYYLGVHTKAPIIGMQGDMGWILPKFRRYINLFSYWNYVNSLDDDRLTTFIFYRDLGKEFRFNIII